ncbi:MAG: filamentous hemagglutinin N-terminal domain-containing protein, partial [Betaproteobacteria bacterium]|nr:filamentous hemagglutinin N-terminal domain-containing protein [Betaproteobacteria bacterium]
MRAGAMLAALASGAMLLTPLAAYANPNAPTVVSGSASFNSAGSTLTVTNSAGAIINWQGFSIGASETTQFVQPSVTSAVLNRVTGPDGSQILGTLQSNGQVFLINPAGVFFGAGARVDVAGLVASTLNLSDQDFLAGKLNFSAAANSGAVVNQGAIATPLGGSVLLIGTSIENSGVITAPGGNVVLAAGRSVLLGDTAAPNVLVQIQADGEQATNLGRIAASGGQIGIYGGLVRQAGVVSANGAGVDAGGNIVFQATRDVTLEAASVTTANGASGGSVRIEATGGTHLVSGAVSATGSAGAGGSVMLLGQNVGLLDGAAVDASGATAGGTILVGGDYQGKNTSVMNAGAVFAGANTLLRADATNAGDGGRIILWSEQATRAYGAISARGGANGGNGGFVETSSRDYLYVDRAPDLGSGGTWLLDPTDITIQSTAGTFDAQGCTTTFTISTCFLAGPPTTATLSNTLINTALDAGSSVIISTSSLAAAPAGGTITVNADAPITKTTGLQSTLTMIADNNIIINAGISDVSGNGLNLALAANSASLNPGATVTLASGASISTGGGTLSANQTLIANGSISTANAGNTAWGAVNVNAAQFNAPLTSGALTATGNLTFGAGTHAINGLLDNSNWSAHDLTTTLNDGAILTLSNYVNSVDNLVTTPGASGVQIVGPGASAGYWSWLQVWGANGFKANTAGSGVTSVAGLDIVQSIICLSPTFCYSPAPTPVDIAGGTLVLGGTLASPSTGTLFASTLTLGAPGAPAQITGTGAVKVLNDFTAAAGSSITMTQSLAGTPSGSYLSSVSLTQQSGSVGSLPITADDVNLTAAGSAVIDPTVGSFVNSNTLSLSQQTGSMALNTPITTDVFYAYATSPGSGITLSSTVTADSVSLNSDVAATYGSLTFAPRNGTRLINFDIYQYSGDLAPLYPIDADNVTLGAGTGSILHNPSNAIDVTANSLSLSAWGGSVGTLASPFVTSVGTLSADSSAPLGSGGIYLNNTLASGALAIRGAHADVNDIQITNNTDIWLSGCTGDCVPTAPTIVSKGGNITLQSTNGSIANDPSIVMVWGSPTALPPGSISADGYGLTRPNGNGGSVTLIAAQNVDMPGSTITANGWDGSLYNMALGADNNAGNGGLISVSAAGGLV